MSPASVVVTGTTWSPAMAALAGFVPCAESGIRQTLRFPSPRLSWYARIISSPVNSPCEPAFGCRLTAWKPVIAASCASRSAAMRAKPRCCSGGAKGWTSANSGQVTGSISAVAFSFIVQEPSGIIEVVSERSRSFSLWR